MKELKKCPFCGGEAKLTKGITYLDNYVTCCECFSRTKTYNTKESAIKSWNKRNQWIPCSERMPKENDWYLITARYIGTYTVDWCFWNGTEWLMGDFTSVKEFNNEIEILAWQPLPPKFEG